jgi:hypothetical protein
MVQPRLRWRALRFHHRKKLLCDLRRIDLGQ